MSSARVALIAATLLQVAACDSRSCNDAPAPSASSSSAPSITSPGPATNALVAARPYRVRMPSAGAGNPPLPVVLGLHGYTGESFQTDDIVFHLGPLTGAKRFIFAGPEGTRDSHGRPFWNATDACCNFYGGTVDDVAYLGAVLDDLGQHAVVDPKRTYVIGHSNGGFMANRLACDLTTRVAGVAIVAGASWENAERCHPSRPVAVLTVRSDSDPYVTYDGGALAPIIAPDAPGPAWSYPSALETASFWAKANGCDPTPETIAEPLDFDDLVPGAETTVTRWKSCAAGGASELWTVHGGGHDPHVSATGALRIWEFFASHPQPCAASP